MTTEMLSARLTECGIPHDAELPAKLLRYHELLLDWNTRMDLTAVTDEAEMIDKHYVDSLSALAVPGLIPQTGSLIDVGTGAGFPGLPLALACPGLKVTLMDAQQKRLNFLQAVIDDLGVRNVTLVHARAEDGAITFVFSKIHTLITNISACSQNLEKNSRIKNTNHLITENIRSIANVHNFSCNRIYLLNFKLFVKNN